MLTANSLDTRTSLELVETVFLAGFEAATGAEVVGAALFRRLRWWS